jgi:hypothetical protein
MKRVAVSMCTAFMLFAGFASAQTTTYYLHNEYGSNYGTFALKTNSPDAATAIRQSQDLKGTTAPRSYDFSTWTSLVGVPNMAGVIPAGSTVTVTLWMKKTSAYGTVYPTAFIATVETLDVNLQIKHSLCSATGTQALDTTLRAYTFSCTTPSVGIASTERMLVSPGYSMT